MKGNRLFSQQVVDALSDTAKKECNIELCPFCGKDVIQRINEHEAYCMDCGRDFRIGNC